jgi:FkbM family methyltransferase
LSLRGMGISNHSNYKISGERHFLNKLLPKYSPTLIFDVGANVGNYTKAARAVNNCDVYAFEPNPPTTKRLIENTKHLTKVKAFELGFSDVSGETQIFDKMSQESSSQATLYSEVISDVYHSEIKSSTVQLETIDQFCIKENISKISLLKIDTEGNEYKILLGATSMLASNAIDIIHFEFNVMNITSRVFFKDFFKLLSNYNFYRLLPNSLLEINYTNPVEYEIFAFQNIIAVRKDIDKER